MHMRKIQCLPALRRLLSPIRVLRWQPESPQNARCAAGAPWVGRGTPPMQGVQAQECPAGW